MFILILLGILVIGLLALVLISYFFWDDVDLFCTMIFLFIVVIIIFLVMTIIYINYAGKINYLNKKYELNYTADDYFFNENDIKEEIEKIKGE